MDGGQIGSDRGDREARERKQRVERQRESGDTTRNLQTAIKKRSTRLYIYI